MKYILVIDQGTSSTRAHLVDSKGVLIFTEQKALKIISSQSGFVEQDPDEIWSSVLHCVAKAIAFANNSGFKIVSCAITNQRETSVVWHRKTQKPVYNAISWQDSRTAEICSKVSEDDISYIRSSTGLVLSPYFSASKIKWIFDNVLNGKAYEDYACGTIDSFLLFKLTNGLVHKTDSTNASRTLLYNIKSLSYDKRLLDIFGISHSILPEVCPTISDFGVVDKSFFDVEIPIDVMIGDQQSAAVGHKCFDRKSAKATFGTGCFLMMNIGENFQLFDESLLTTILYNINGNPTYALEGSIFYAGSALNWVKDNLELFSDFDEAEKLINSVGDNDGVFCVPALSGLGAPYWQSCARAVFVGMTNSTTKAHLVRSVYESIVYQLNDLFRVIKQGDADIKSLSVDGGVVNSSWFNQFLSDILDIDILKSDNCELTSVGAAYLAGIKLGFYESFSDVKQLKQGSSFFQAKDISPAQRESLLRGWSLAIESSINYSVDKL